MTPYLRAYEAYHRDGEPHIPWTTALDFHLQHGLVYASPCLFFMGRFVPSFAPDHEHPDLIPFPCAPGFAGAFSDFHVWSAAGNLGLLLNEAAEHCVETLTFQRRNNRLHRVKLRHLFKRLAKE
jgi:hypothetical protein